MPDDIPSNPENTYRNEGWTGYGNWLGTGAISSHDREFKSFKNARSFARSLRLKTYLDWRAFIQSGRLPPDIPSNPAITYRNKGWTSYGDWLGTGTVALSRRRYWPFVKARKLVRSLGLKREADWRVFSKSEAMPPDIPSNPGNYYRDKGWAGMGDWLGTGTVATRDRKYKPFQKARAFARSLGLESTAEWRAYANSNKLPEDIPSNPNNTYRDGGWAGFSDWLGNGRPPRRRRQMPHRL